MTKYPHIFEFFHMQKFKDTIKDEENKKKQIKN